MLRHLCYRVFHMCKLDVKPKLHFALYSYASLWPLTSMKHLMIAHYVLEALGRIANYIKIVNGV